MTFLNLKLREGFLILTQNTEAIKGKVDTFEQ